MPFFDSLIFQLDYRVRLLTFFFNSLRDFEIKLLSICMNEHDLLYGISREIKINNKSHRNQRILLYIVNNNKRYIALSDRKKKQVDDVMFNFNIANANNTIIHIIYLFLYIFSTSKKYIIKIICSRFADTKFMKPKHYYKYS